MSINSINTTNLNNNCDDHCGLYIQDSINAIVSGLDEIYRIYEDENNTESDDSKGFDRFNVMFLFASSVHVIGQWLKIRKSHDVFVNKEENNLLTSVYEAQEIRLVNMLKKLCFVYEDDELDERCKFVLLYWFPHIRNVVLNNTYTPKTFESNLMDEFEIEHVENLMDSEKWSDITDYIVFQWMNAFDNVQKRQKIINDVMGLIKKKQLATKELEFEEDEQNCVFLIQSSNEFVYFLTHFVFLCSHYGTKTSLTVTDDLEELKYLMTDWFEQLTKTTSIDLDQDEDEDEIQEYEIANRELVLEQALCIIQLTPPTTKHKPLIDAIHRYCHVTQDKLLNLHDKPRNVFPDYGFESHYSEMFTKCHILHLMTHLLLCYHLSIDTRIWTSNTPIMNNINSCHPMNHVVWKEKDSEVISFIIKQLQENGYILIKKMLSFDENCLPLVKKNKRKLNENQTKWKQVEIDMLEKLKQIFTAPKILDVTELKGNSKCEFTPMQSDYFYHKNNKTGLFEYHCASNASSMEIPLSPNSEKIPENIDERQSTCFICFNNNDDDENESVAEMLICDVCECSFHTACLKKPPCTLDIDVKWICSSCTNSQYNCYTTWVPLENRHHDLLSVVSKSHLWTDFEQYEPFSLPNSYFNSDYKSSVKPLFHVPKSSSVHNTIQIDLGDVVLFNMKNVYCTTRNEINSTSKSMYIRFCDGFVLPR